MKTIIYQELGIFKTTTEENYKRNIQNAHEVQTWKNFETAEQIINYCIDYCGKKKEDFIIA